MKLAKAELNHFVNNPPGQYLAAVFSGKDRALVREQATRLAKILVPDINDPFNVSQLTETDIDSDAAILEDELCALSLMGGRRLIRLKFFNEKATLDRIVATTLKSHAAGDLNREAFLILECGAFAGDSALRKLCESDKHIAYVPIYEEEAGDIIRLTRAKLAADKVSLTTAAMDIFIKALPKEHGIALQEIERLICFIGPNSNKTLNETEILDFLGGEPEGSFFKASLDAFGGRLKGAQAGIRRAFAEGEPAVMAIRAISLHYNRLRQFKSLLETGTPLKQAARIAGIFWKDEDEYARQARAWRQNALDALASDIVETDIQCKSTGMPDLLLAERLYLQIAGRAAKFGL
jgi:DNA polymerase-3 subunit delta